MFYFVRVRVRVHTNSLQKYYKLLEYTSFLMKKSNLFEYCHLNTCYSPDSTKFYIHINILTFYHKICENTDNLSTRLCNLQKNITFYANYLVAP